MSDLHVDPQLEIKDRELANLISRVAQGEEQAFSVFYDRTSSHVYGLVLRVLNDPTMAEEVTLDVYMQVWRQADQFNLDRGKPIVWLAVLARSRAIDRLRAGKKEREGRQDLETIESVSAIKGNPEESSVYNQQCRLVQKALTALASEQRQVIEMAYFGGLSQSEIAAQIGEPLGTVKTRIRLGMIKLRNILGPLEKGLIS